MEIQAESMDWEQSKLKNTLSDKFDANSNQTHLINGDSPPPVSTSPDVEQDHSDSEISLVVERGIPTECSRSPSPSLTKTTPSDQSGVESMTPMNLTKPVSKNLGMHAVSNLLKSGSSSPTALSDYRPVPTIPSSGLPTMIPMNLVKSEPQITDNTASALLTSSPIKSTPTGQTTKAKTTKSGSKKSFVWRYFQHPKMEDGSADKTRTQCLLCNNQLAFNASGTTTTMLNHLKSRHSDVADSEEYRRRQVKIPNAGQSNSKTVGGGKAAAKTSSLAVNGLAKASPTNTMMSDASWTSLATVEGSSGKANTASSASRKKQDVIRSLLKTDVKQDPRNQAMAHSSLVIGGQKQQQVSLSRNHLEEHYSALGHSLAPSHHVFSPEAQDSPVELTSGSSSVASSKLNGLSLTNFLPSSTGLNQIPSSSAEAATFYSAGGSNSMELNKKLSRSPGKRKRGKPNHLPLDNRKRAHLEVVDQLNNNLGEDWQTSVQRHLLSGHDSADLTAVLNRLKQHHHHEQQQQQHQQSVNMGDNFPASSEHQQLCPKKMADAIAFFLVRDLCPISILAGEGFRTLMRNLVPAVRSPDVETMRRHILPKLYETAELKLRTEFRQSDLTGASLSLEIWPRENKHYASIKVHYVDSQMRELKSKLLKTKEINAQVLCSELLMENYHSLGLMDISGPCPVVVNNPEPLRDELDNAVIPDIQERFMVIPCLVSCLSDALKAGFTLPEVASLVTRCRGLDESGDGDFEGTTQGGGGEESWLCAYNMLRQMATAYPDLKQRYSQSVSYEHMLLSSDEEELLDKLVPVIESINQTLETISNGSLFMTASMIKPIICNLRKKQLSGTNGLSTTIDVIGVAHSPVSDIINGSTGPATGGGPAAPPSSAGCSIAANGGGEFAAEVVIQFKAAVWQHLCQFYQESGPVHNTLWIATLVDPRFKRSYESHAGNFEERATMVKLLKEEVGESDNSFDSTDRPENSDLQQVFGQEYFSSHSNSEVDRYLQEAPIRLKDNPLQWWSANSTNFPRVAEVARRYLCIPVTSVSGNRSFPADDSSTSINAKRASIDPEDLDTYLFLSHNWQL